MRKNRMMRLASTLLVLTLLTTCAISGTFAKYTSTSTASDTVRVAKWSFKVGDKDIAKETMVFNLFETIKDTDGTTEEDVKSGKIIAPGTSGEFTISLANLSEVNAKYSIAFAATTTAIPLEYSTDDGATWKTSIVDLNVTDKDIAMENDTDNDTDSVTVDWRWSFDPTVDGWTDEKDTNLGIAAQGANQEITITATITATQVD